MSIMQKVLALGDLGKLSPEEKAEYYQEVCRSLGLNPLTQPFAYISLNGRLRLYALKEASDQLRDTRRITLKITSKEIVEDVYVVEAQATTPDNRTDTDIGAVAIAGLKGESRANAMMKAMTKAKRRVTLSICGLGWLDETEIETIPVNAITERIDPTTGEILEPQVQSPSPPAQQPVPPKNGKAVSPITQTPAFRALMAWLHDEQIAEEPFKRFLHESGVLPVDEQGELHWAALSEVNLRGVLGKKEGCLARFRPFSEMLAHLQGEGIDMERFRDFLSTIIPTEAGKILSLATLPQELHAALPGAIHDYRIWEGEGDAVEEMENEEF